MSFTKRELLRVLKNELQFLESGGYAIFEKTSWRPAMFFEDSPTCPNHGLARKSVPCTECALMQLIPIGKRNHEIPCRDIPLNDERETLQSLYETATRHELEWKLDQWLRRTIARLDKEVHDSTFPVVNDSEIHVSKA